MVNDDIDFNYESGANPVHGCAVSLRGRMWYFGGYGAQDIRQVSKEVILPKLNLILKASKVVGCKMTRQSDLPFDFYGGSCNTFAVPEEKVLMCFSEDSRKSCRV